MRVTIITLFLIFHYCIPEKISVLILARGGSKGIRLKNLREVGGITLLSRAILAAKHAGLEDITVSTDHPLIALEGIKRGVQVFKRSYVTASDWAPSIWGVQEFIEYKPQVDILVLLQTTSPFTKSKHIKRSLEKLDRPKPYDCIFSVTRYK
ncbi:N-acylneuraminate cytidylyltransferase [Zerene cesonia]|uniref:N-acylneuraminate cytidylyltransferase n=1 Tax=Zerene cesonia TaxID=33412 RepID=UPI0018E572EA|nr:N-acylneuraminate cytidylyltransferase [Zerene cesonia]